MVRGTKRKINGREVDTTTMTTEKNHDEERGGYSEESPGKDKGGGGISATIDPDVLDCPICFEPLRPPLFLCRNGHVACSTCCVKLQNKCPSCSQSIDYSRCLALEKVVESIKVPCSYANGGCRSILPYADRLQHEDTCVYSPCFCPMSSCSFSGSTQLLSTHFDECHKNSYKRLLYDEFLPVFLKFDEPFLVLHAPGSRVFLLLNNKDAGITGNALCMTCIGPQALDGEFTYELMVTRNGSSLQLKASMTNIKKWMGSYPTNVFLLVPQDFYLFEQIFVTVRIRKKGT